MTERVNDRFPPRQMNLGSEEKNAETKPQNPSDEVKNFSRYIIDDAPPAILSGSEQYAAVMKELIEPPASIPFKLFPKLQEMTGGLRPNEFTILCGQTGSGKTTLAANISLDLCLSKVPHFVASVETGANDFHRRVVSAMVEKDWNSGEPVPLDELDDFDANVKPKLNQQNLYFYQYDNRIPVERLMNDLVFVHLRKKVQIAIIDNLNFFLEVTNAKDGIMEMDRVVHELVVFTKRVPMHIIMIMHPRKTASGRIENEGDIKGSSLAVQEAFNIFAWQRPDPGRLKDGICEPDDRELTVLKMRRRGRYVGATLVFSHTETVRYRERKILSFSDQAARALSQLRKITDRKS